MSASTFFTPNPVMTPQKVKTRKTPRIVMESITDLGTLKSKGISPLCVGAKDAFAPAELFENTLLGVTGAQGWNSLTTSNDKWNSDQVKQAATSFTQMLPYFDCDASASTWDQATGKLTPTGETLTTPSPICISFLPLQ